MNDDTEKKYKADLDFWKNSPTEGVGRETVVNLVNKFSEITILYECIIRYKHIFENAGTVVELGAGQGWASCLIKKMFPTAHITATDISPDAVASIGIWERIFNVKVDAAYACRSDQTKEPDESVDVVFCFAAAHHFQEHRKTLQDVMRILKKGGSCIYFYEPSCLPLWHSLTRAHMQDEQAYTTEDVLQYPELLRLAREAGLTGKVDFCPSIWGKRSPLMALYLIFLKIFSFLQRLLPCNANFLFTKETS
jgi:SAM-dependent methyltransferase